MKRIFRQYALGLVVIVSTFIIAACHKPPLPSSSFKGPHPLTPYQHHLVAQVRSSGARVIKQGRVLQIILPTDTFFRKNTTRLKRHKLYALDRVATLIKSYITPYRHPRITVTGYTDHIFNRTKRQKLSLNYAKEIVAYLWHRGVSQRNVRVRGMGATCPIASNRTAKGAADNRRIVIRIN